METPKVVTPISQQDTPEPEIIENGICDSCGKDAQYLQVVNCAPVVNACICRACLEDTPPITKCLDCGQVLSVETRPIKSYVVDDNGENPQPICDGCDQERWKQIQWNDE